jgi:hypothetical protein
MNQRVLRALALACAGGLVTSFALAASLPPWVPPASLSCRADRTHPPWLQAADPHPENDADEGDEEEEGEPRWGSPPSLRAADNPEDFLDTLQNLFLAPAVATNPPGTDTSLCMSWEVSAASDPNDSQRLALVQGSTLALSTDGGDNFTTVSVGASLPPGFTSSGDGTAAYDRYGRLFVAILGNPVAAPGLHVFVSRHDPVSGALVSGPVDVTAQVGLSTATSDKPWLAADAHPGSPYANRLYVVWSVTGGTQSGDKEIWGAVSTNQGANWSQMTANGLAFGPISPLDASDGSCWPPHVAVGLAGDVFVSYHGQPDTLPDVGTPDGKSGKVVVLRSTDGGATFPQRSEAFPGGFSDATANTQSDPGSIPDARFWTYGTRQAWVLPDPDDACTLHVVASDDPDNDPTFGDAADVVMATSHDCGLSWPVRQTVSDGPVATWQLLPTAAIDPNTGAIAVAWLDNRDAPSYPAGSAGNARVDLRARYSLDGGAHWLPSRIVNDLPIDPDASSSVKDAGPPPTYRIGEYEGVAFAGCSAHFAWSGQATCNGTMDTYYDRDPEVGDLDAPDIFCPADVVLGCSDSTESAAGKPTTSDTCDVDPDLTYVDQNLGGSCPPTPVIADIKRIWSATDAAGNIASCEQKISIEDFDAPVIDVPAPLELECSSLGGVPSSSPFVQDWLHDASALDACSTATLGISGVPALFPVGCGGQQTLVTFSASDACGNSDFELGSVIVTDTTKPSLVAPVARRFECTKAGGTPKSDPGVAAWLASATSADACSVPVVTNDAPNLLPAGCTPGTGTVVHFTSTDGCGNQKQASSTATVVDSSAPEVTSPPIDGVLLPPNHDYQCFDDVRASVGVVDDCKSLPIGKAISCSSSQCDDAPCAEHPGENGDGSTTDDCTYDPVLDRLCARAERAETDPIGRRYLIIVTATDACGNARSEPVLELFVPHGCAEGDGNCLLVEGFESGNLLVWPAHSP